MWSSVAMAQQASAQGGPSMIENLLPFVFMFGILYMFMIRPQQKRAKTQQEFLSQLKKGDSVLTSSGIFGTIEGLNEKFVTLEVSEDVRLRVLRSHISSSVEEDSK